MSANCLVWSKRDLPGIHSYAEDMQLYLAFKPDYVLSTNEAISVMELCVREIRAWILCDKLKINDDKTEVVIIGTNPFGVDAQTLYVNRIMCM